MARSREEIEALLIEEERKYPAFADLATNSRTSRAGVWRQILAFITNYFERLLDRHREEVDRLIVNNRFGSLDWFRTFSFEYQNGIELTPQTTDEPTNFLNFGTHYFYADTSSSDAVARKIITRLRLQFTDGNVVLTPIKGDPGAREYLSDAELDGFERYILAVSPVTVPIIVNRINKDYWVRTFAGGIQRRFTTRAFADASLGDVIVRGSPPDTAGEFPDILKYSIIGTRVSVVEDRNVIANGSYLDGTGDGVFREALDWFINEYPTDDPVRVVNSGQLYYSEIQEFLLEGLSPERLALYRSQFPDYAIPSYVESGVRGLVSIHFFPLAHQSQGTVDGLIARDQGILRWMDSTPGSFDPKFETPTSDGITYKAHPSK